MDPRAMIDMDLDKQRSYAFALGVIGLLTELFIWSLTQNIPPQWLTGAFTTFVIAPVLGGTVSKIKKNGNGGGER